METPFTFQLPSGVQPRPFKRGDFSGTEESRQLLAKYGDPVCFAYEGARIAIFEIDPHGDGLIIPRFSSQDENGGETVIAQAHRLLAMAETQGLRVRYLIVTENNSGKLEFERRIDFAIAVSAIRSGWCRWVGYAKVDRIARLLLEAEILFDYLRRTRTRLHIADTNGGREVDLSDSNATLFRQFESMIAEKERNEIQARTHGELRRRFLEQGKEWPCPPPPGFDRATKNRHRRANKDFASVKELFQRYDALGREIEATRTGIREAVDSMNADGFKINGKKISYTQAYNVLSNSLYVTGHWTMTVEGIAYPCWTEPIDDPVDPELFNRVQLRLGTHTGNVKPGNEGLRFLNAIKLFHASGLDEDADEARPVRLSAHIGRKGIADRYTHHPRTPTWCKGHEGYEADQVERAVVRSLRLAASARGICVEWHAREFERWCDTIALPVLGRPDPRSNPSEYWRWLKDIAEQGIARVEAGDEVADLDDEMERDLACRMRANEIADVLPRIPFYRSDFWMQSDEDGLAEAFLAHVTEEPPDDPSARVLRQALIEAALDGVNIHDTEDGPAFELVGRLVPKEFVRRGPISPQQLAARELDAFLLGTPLAATVPQGYGYGTVAAFENGVLGELVPAFRSPLILF